MILHPSNGRRVGIWLLAILVALAPPLSATWSIVVIDTATGEVAVGCATCLAGLDLEDTVPVMLPGIGAACAQSSIDGSGANRRLIWDLLIAGTAPVDILEALRQSDGSHASRQYGIVDLQGRAATFTGAGAGQWRGGRTGQIGTITYAIQGNVLAGKPVLDAAEQALVSTPGDLSDRLMEAMLAAARFGGDGRCSCSGTVPDSCGAPPPGFDPETMRSAHIGFVMVSRQGDARGVCNRVTGCAAGSYYLDLNITPQPSGPHDPTIELAELYDDWRAATRGRPDHLKTVCRFTEPSVPASSTAVSDLLIELADWTGEPIRHGGHGITVQHAIGSSSRSSIGAVVDRGDGRYLVPITSGERQGTDVFEVWVDDGVSMVKLYPDPSLEITEALLTDQNTLSASTGGTVNFELIGPRDQPTRRPYLLLASISGRRPGTPLGDTIVPLNFDAVFLASYVFRNSSVFVNTHGMLDREGHGRASFVVTPELLRNAAGIDIMFAFVTPDRFDYSSHPVTVSITP